MLLLNYELRINTRGEGLDDAAIEALCDEFDKRVELFIEALNGDERVLASVTMV